MEWLNNELWSVLKPHIAKFINKIIIKCKIKRITRKLSNQILSEFKNEVYYNEFDKFLSVNKVISNFIQNSIASGAHDSEDINSFVNKRIDNFVIDNPRFLAYRSSIAGMLKRLFLLIFNELNTIDNEDLKHVVCILKEQTLAIEKSIGDLCEKIDELSEKNDRNAQAILDYLEQNIGKGIEANVEFVSSVITVPFIPAEINKHKLCIRQTVISSIIDDVHPHDWLHVNGSAWSGKTTTARLVMQNLGKSLWIDFSYGEPITIIKSFEYYFMNALSTEGESYTIIMDNLPDIHVGDAFLGVFCSFICDIKKRGHKIITFGSYPISSYVLNHISEQYEIDINSMLLPEFSVDDVVELMRLFNAPQFLTSNRTSEFLLELAGKKPAAIKIMLHYLKSNNWDINSNHFLNIFTLDIEDLTREIQNIVSTSIKDEKTRELLYRISLVGHEISRRDLEIIANVEPSINMIGERLDLLKGVWVTGDNFIKANGLLRNISNGNLNSTTKSSIHGKMADSILSKHILDQIDISNVICHLVASERMNDAGRIYILAMQSLGESNIEYNESFLFVKMWYNMPLPDSMDDSIKATIRLLQIIYFTQCGENCDYLATDLIDLSKRDEKIRELLMAGGALLIQKNHVLAMKLINASNEQGIPSQFDLMEETGLNPLDAIIKLSFMTAENLDDISTWFALVKGNLSNDAIRELEATEGANLFRHGFEKVRLGITPSKVNDLLLVIEEIFNYAVSCSWKYLASGCAITLIRLVSENQHNYDQAKVLYEKYCNENRDHIFVANAKYCMGLLAIDHKDYSFAIKCLCDASVSHEGLDDLEKVLCCANCYIAFSKSSMLAEAKAAISQALSLIIMATNIEPRLHEELLFKIHFERIICLYLSKDFCDSLDSLEYINDYLMNNPVEGNEHFISITCHCLSYIHADLLRHNPPKHLGNEEYTVPYCGIMLNQSNTEDFIKQTNKPKKAMIGIVSAQLLDYFGKDEKCHKYLLYGWKDHSTDDEYATLSLLTFFSGYGLYKLFEIKEYVLAGRVLSNILGHYSQVDNPNTTFVDHTIIRLTFFIVGHLDISKEIVEELKKIRVSSVLEEKWNAWLEVIELSTQKNNAQMLVAKGNDYYQKNNWLLQAICYIGATSEAEFKELLKIYLIVLSSLGDIMVTDLFWLNNILIPTIKEQLLHAFINTGISNSVLTQMLSDKNEYCFDDKIVKKILKDSVAICGINYFKEESVLWLNS